MKYIYIKWILIVGVLLYSHLKAQNITTRVIPSLDKLPVNAIHRIFQDSDGYMWYGTFNGLCRYDGYNIKTFRSDFNRPDLLNDNYITYINEDHHKKIWFGTYKGVYTLDKKNFQITSVDLGANSDKWIFSINVTSDGHIWVSVPGTLYRFNSDGSIRTEYDLNINDSLRKVYFVYKDKAGDILISTTGGGMYRLNKSIDEFEPYFHHIKYPDIERIIWDEKHQCYWLGTWGHGIIRFDPNQKNKDLQFVPQPLPVDILGNQTGNLFHMVQDDDLHYLWVTTLKNLFAFQIKDNGMLNQVDTSPFLSSENKILYEIIKDKEGKLWVSSFDTQSFIVDIRQNRIKKYALPQLRKRIHANPAINSFYVDNKDKIWLSQERYGLCIYDLKTNEVLHYTDCDAIKNLPLWEITEFLPSQHSISIWVIPMTSEIYGLSLDKTNNISLDNRIQLNHVVDQPGIPIKIFEDTDNNLWIGTTNELLVYNISSKKLDVVLKDVGHVADISQTKEGEIWVVVKNKGIYLVNSNLQTQLFPIVKDFDCIDASSDGKLWIGTGKGEILLFDSVKEKLEDYSAACEMKGDIINNIVVDEYNHLWIITNQEIKEFNPNNSAYRVYSTRNDDFLLDRIIAKSVHYEKKGDIYIGGISGIISISPSQQLEGIPEHVKTQITDIKVLDHSVWNDTIKRDLEKNTLFIDPQDQNIEISFSSLDYHNLNQIRYAYRMKDVDNEWVYLSENKNSAFYNKLQKGSYLFQVKSTDKHGLWSNEITELNIVRLPYWYESWWAYVIYSISIAGLFIYIIYVNRKRIELKSSQKWADSAEMVKMHQYIQNSKSQSSSEFKDLDQMLIDKATNIVLDNLGDSKFNVETLATAMNMSRSTLSRKIKLITNKTAFDFIKQIKMHQACLLLENKTATINDVMLTLGYNDYKSFINSFKSIYGVSPSEYQKNSRA